MPIPTLHLVCLSGAAHALARSIRILCRLGGQKRTFSELPPFVWEPVGTRLWLIKSQLLRAKSLGQHSSGHQPPMSSLVCSDRFGPRRESSSPYWPGRLPHPPPPRVRSLGEGPQQLSQGAPNHRTWVHAHGSPSSRRGASSVKEFRGATRFVRGRFPVQPDCTLCSCARSSGHLAIFCFCSNHLESQTFHELQYGEAVRT